MNNRVKKKEEGCAEAVFSDHSFAIVVVRAWRGLWGDLLDVEGSGCVDTHIDCLKKSVAKEP